MFAVQIQSRVVAIIVDAGTSQRNRPAQYGSIVHRGAHVLVGRGCGGVGPHRRPLETDPRAPVGAEAGASPTQDYPFRRRELDRRSERAADGREYASTSLQPRHSFSGQNVPMQPMGCRLSHLLAQAEGHNIIRHRLALAPRACSDIASRMAPCLP